jgi:hypothetical protein
MTLFLASKACDGPQLLSGAHEGIVTHIGALKALDML